MLDLYFYLDSKYGFSETEIPEREVKRVFIEKLPLHVEQFFRNLFSKVYGLKAEKSWKRAMILILCYFPLER